MASTATQDPVEHLLRDIESQMDVLRQYIHEDTIWDGTAVYCLNEQLGVEGISRTVQRFQSSMERFAPQPPLPLPAADVEDPPPPVYSSMEDSPPPVYSNMENTPPPVYLYTGNLFSAAAITLVGWLSWFFWKEGKDLCAGARVFLMLNAIARAWNAPTGTFSERLDKTRKGLLLVA